MKKVLSGVLTAILMASMMTTVFAAETEITVGGTQSAETLVTYEMAEAYTVIIPDAVVIEPTTNKGSAIVGAEKIVIDFGKTLNVKIGGHDNTDAWQLIDVTNSANTINYTIGTTDGGNDVVNNTVVLSSVAGANWNDSVENTLYFSLNEDVEKSGSYEDTLTFTVSID